MTPIFVCACMAAIGGTMFGFGTAHKGSAPAIIAVIGACMMMTGAAATFGVVAA